MFQWFMVMESKARSTESKAEVFVVCDRYQAAFQAWHFPRIPREAFVVAAALVQKVLSSEGFLRLQIAQSKS